MKAQALLSRMEAQVRMERQSTTNAAHSIIDELFNLTLQFRRSRRRSDNPSLIVASKRVSARCRIPGQVMWLFNSSTVYRFWCSPLSQPSDTIILSSSATGGIWRVRAYCTWLPERKDKSTDSEMYSIRERPHFLMSCINIFPLVTSSLHAIQRLIALIDEWISLRTSWCRHFKQAIGGVLWTIRLDRLILLLSWSRSTVLHLCHNGMDCEHDRSSRENHQLGFILVKARYCMYNMTFEVLWQIPVLLKLQLFYRDRPWCWPPANA